MPQFQPFCRRRQDRDATPYRDRKSPLAGFFFLSFFLIATPALATGDALPISGPPLTANPLPLSHGGPGQATVVATVNGEPITKEEIIKKFGGAVKKENFSDAIDEVIAERLVNKEVDRQKIRESEEYKSQLKDIEYQLGRQIFLTKYMADKTSPAKVEAAYNAYKKAQEGRPEVHVREIVVAEEDTAKRVVTALEKGSPFEFEAKDKSMGPLAKHGGEVPGYFAREELFPAFVSPIFDLKVGGWSKPVKTAEGFAIFKVDDKRARTVPAMQQLEESIKGKLEGDAKKELVSNLRAKEKIEILKPSGE